MHLLRALVCPDPRVEISLLLGPFADLEEVLGQDDFPAAGAVLFFPGKLHHLFPIAEVAADRDLDRMETEGYRLPVQDRRPSHLVAIQEHIRRRWLGVDL